MEMSTILAQERTKGNVMRHWAKPKSLGCFLGPHHTVFKQSRDEQSMEVVHSRRLLAYKPLRWESVREIYDFQTIELNKANQAYLESVQNVDSCYCLIILKGKIIGLSKLVNVDSDVVRSTKYALHLLYSTVNDVIFRF